MAALGSAKRFDLGRVLSRTLAVIGSNFVPFMSLALVLAGVPKLISVLLQPVPPGVGSPPQAWAISVAMGIVDMGLGSVLAASIAEGAIRDLDHRKVVFEDVLSAGLRFGAPALLVGIVSAVGIGLGFILLIVPGVLIALAWSVAVPALVVERVGPFTALARSRALTRGNRWSLFLLFLVNVVLLFVAGLPLGLLSVGMSAAVGGNLWVTRVVTALYSAFGALFNAVLVTAAYAELRGSRDGVGVKELAAIFD